ncbi:hypothetical protein N7466_008615 [Penicillium verhagenii]|uniref:uncharacterized protein n=1 Tax=Penicillium verhagenii TaxID=1562060 RepID=UPI00254597C3|nr:uncharacterized protein N7466_008615 [Penicillium verhagenii]KAJ5924428.1 hypothetical protein N7466_008615 [Penicillium verhagenii]
MTFTNPEEILFLLRTCGKPLFLLRTLRGALLEFFGTLTGKLRGTSASKRGLPCLSASKSVSLELAFTLLELAIILVPNIDLLGHVCAFGLDLVEVVAERSFKTFRALTLICSHGGELTPMLEDVIHLDLVGLQDSGEQL